MKFNPEQRFFVTGDLLYPAALGAGIAWTVEALVHWRVHANARASAGWSLLFGLLFILYHSRSFVVLRDGISRDTAGNIKYSWPEFAKDFIDCVALVLAFVCLRFPGGKLALVDPAATFGVVALIPLVALITGGRFNSSFWNWSWPLRLVSLMVGVIGAAHAHYVRQESFAPSCWDWTFLVLLFALLAVYIVRPHWFGAPKKGDGPLRRELSPCRAVIAVLVVVVVTWGVMGRIRAEPVEAVPEGWVLAGIVRDFDSGKPCSATPEIGSQIAAVITSLKTMHPLKVRVSGVADVRPLSDPVREFVGNNVGLAHMRAECVMRRLTRPELIGVEFIKEFIEQTDLPSNFRSADSMDRVVVIWAWPGERR